MRWTKLKYVFFNLVSFSILFVELLLYTSPYIQIFAHSAFDFIDITNYVKSIILNASRLFNRFLSFLNLSSVLNSDFLSYLSKLVYSRMSMSVYLMPVEVLLLQLFGLNLSHAHYRDHSFLILRITPILHSSSLQFR